MDPRIANALNEQQRSLNFAIGQAKDALRASQGTDQQLQMLKQQIDRLQEEQRNISAILANAEVAGANTPAGSVRDHSIRYIEQIPGRRIPFDLTVTIPVGANVTTAQQDSLTISQDGPFVAVARYATFQSAFEFSVTDPDTGAQAGFKGRSHGRFRPIHSVTDYADAYAGLISPPTTGLAPPGDGSAIFASPTNHSGFRTMEFDGSVEFRNQGSGYPRQVQAIPSSFYMQDTNDPFPLAALDFFERGETLQWVVTPTHPNNPAYGNLSGFAVGGNYPFLDSQYDVHEGVLDELIDDQASDPVTRLPDGFIIIGFHGFRIIQPPGTVALT